ncbi:hypothetical protein BRM1_05260 [Brevibacterium sp. BRM-1]|uniref:cytochrome b/b6 domain-containing protein n=1 Tax=Brevibacterium sp. BRM-1 TaxID=2999062 RepID=UPI00227E645F|nr:cytochrome b/b6 domain-containing protein [Brevibacterium sp. BRM-1]WAL41259.1 hypothetical protein BRM1_05260 [Brevibacterium sp. BRM-1]
MAATSKSSKGSKKKGKKGKKGKKKGFDPQSLIKPGIYAGIGIVALAILVGIAIWLRSTAGVQAFIARYPGEAPLPEGAPVGLPGWLGWQHFLNFFFMLLIIRSGLLILTTQKPDSFWTRDNTKLVKTKGDPVKMSMNHLIHFSFDFLWVINGIVFFVLLFATGQWMRIVPTTWEVFPNALSAAIQYLSMNWPAENGWVNYNSLQVLAYFTTVFIAAPLAMISGYRLSEIWPIKGEFNNVFSIRIATVIHVSVMVYFLAFTFVHVFLVFATSVVNGHGLFGNLSHTFGAQEHAPLLGFIWFAVAIVAMAAAWVLIRPVFIAPVAGRFGKVTTR